MGYTLSKPTAEKVLRLVNRADLTPVFVPEKSSTVDTADFESVLLCEVESGSPSDGWTCNYFTDWLGYVNGTPTGSCHLWLSDIAEDSDLPVGTVVMGHHVAEQAVGGNDYGSAS